MELSQLRAIIALGELASFSKAGEYLHLSPPAVFGQIRQLEDELGQKLYERIGRRLHLTDAGELLVKHAKTIVEKHDEAAAALRELSGVTAGVLRIGCGPHGSICVLPHLFRAFLAAHPNTEIRLTTGDDRKLISDLRTGLLDVMLMTLPLQDPDFEEEPLWRYEMVFVLPPRGRPGQRPTARELLKYPFILYRRTVVVDAAIREICLREGIEPRVVMENDLPDSIKELVKLGIGASMLPLWSVGDEARAGTLQILRPRNRHLYGYGLVYRRAGYRPKAATALALIAHRWSEWWPMAGNVVPPEFPQSGAADSPVPPGR